MADALSVLCHSTPVMPFGSVVGLWLEEVNPSLSDKEPSKAPHKVKSDCIMSTQSVLALALAIGRQQWGTVLAHLDKPSSASSCQHSRSHPIPSAARDNNFLHQAGGQTMWLLLL